MARENSNLTTDYADYNMFEDEHPALQWLKACVNKSVVDYLHHQGMEYSVEWRLQGWANVNRTGDYHALHNHPHSYLSGTYYVEVPDSYPLGGGRDDQNPGAISFFDPRGASNMTAIRGDGQVDPEYRVDPNAGTILLWPSFLYHFVHPNLSDHLRISISFNVLLKWSDQYLPSQ